MNHISNISFGSFTVFENIFRMKKIAFIGDALDVQYAGIHVYTKEVIRHLVQLDKSNEYFVVRPKAVGDIEGVTELVVPIKERIPMHQRIRLFTTIPQLMRKHNIDVVIEPAHFGPFNLPKSIKRITVIHDLTPILFPEYHGAASHYAHRLFLPSILKNADKIVTNSEYTKRDLAKYYPVSEHKTAVLHLGKAAHFVPTIRKNVLEKYGIRSSYFLYVGTLEVRKNLGVLVKAFELFKDKHKGDHQLVLAGKKGWKIEELLAAIENSPYKKDILLTGFIDLEDLPVLYSMATLFVYPSLYEGFGLPILEAMACGSVVVASSASSLPEVGGDAALYFEPTDANALCRQMLRLLNNEVLYQQLKERSLVQARRFSWEATAEGFSSLF